MDLYITGYYGYKNFGDELLLLGLLSYVSSRYECATIYVVTPDVSWLSSWIERHIHFLEEERISPPICITKVPFFPKKHSTLLIGGGEVFTDARPFPYNGWNYVGRYFFWLILGKIIFAGGVGTESRRGTRLLYSLCFSLCRHLIVREKFSYTIASSYTKNLTLHHDFAYDALPPIASVSKNKSFPPPYVVINCNTHIYSNSVHKDLQAYCDGYILKGYQVYFFPGTIGFDDSDGVVFELLKQTIPGLIMYDWTTYSVDEIYQFIVGASGGYAARLHVLLLLKYFSVPFSPLVYQEKVDRLIS